MCFELWIIIIVVVTSLSDVSYNKLSTDVHVYSLTVTDAGPV